MDQQSQFVPPDGGEYDTGQMGSDPELMTAVQEYKRLRDQQYDVLRRIADAVDRLYGQAPAQQGQWGQQQQTGGQQGQKPGHAAGSPQKPGPQKPGR